MLNAEAREKIISELLSEEDTLFRPNQEQITFINDLLMVFMLNL